MKKNKITILVLAIVTLVSIAGCSPTNTKMRNLSTQTRLTKDNVNSRWMSDTPYTRNGLNTNLNNGMVRNDTILNNDMVNNRTNLSNDITSNRMNLNNGMITDGRLSNNVGQMSTKANDIARRVAALPEVNDASVVIHGNTAIVGCDVKGTTTNNTVNTNLRQKIEAAVKSADKNITKVSITAEPTLYNRIRTMSTNIGNGNPISTFVGDIEDILNRISAPLRTNTVR